jgi:hypothetical protein
MYLKTLRSECSHFEQSNVRRSCPGWSGSVRASTIAAPHSGHGCRLAGLRTSHHRALGINAASLAVFQRRMKTACANNSRFECTSNRLTRFSLATIAANPLQWPPRGAQMSKVYAGLLVVAALFAMAALGTLILVTITDVSHLAFPTESPGMSP